jgi:nicotinate-nucleotide adenylyltransferase
MRIGICGGTFDPFHRGHLEPILAARETMEWDRVLYVPAFVQPFKQQRQTASPYHRFTMAVLGTEDQEGLFVSPQELERGAISYTVDTLQQLRSDHPDAKLDWIVGDDNLEQLLEWKSVETLFELARFVVLARGVVAVPAALKPRVSSGAIAFARNATVPVSSTEIRRRVRDGESIDDLVPPRVPRYIQRNGLYRKGQP